MISASMAPTTAKHSSLPRSLVRRGEERALGPGRREIPVERAPLQRIAALLSSISRNNSYEGRDPAIIPDSLASGFVADLLGMTLPALASSLVQLEQRGLIRQERGGAIRLLDRPALDEIMDH